MPISICSQLPLNYVDSFTWGAWGRASRSLRWWWPCGPSQPARCPPLCTEPSSAWRRLWSGLGLVFSVATRGKGKKSCVTAYLYPHQPQRVTTCCPLIGWLPVNTLISLVRKYTSKDPFPNFFWSMKVSMSKPTDLHNLVHFCFCHYNLTAITCHMKN